MTVDLNVSLLLLVVLLGSFGGILSGFFGIGGGIIMAPLLLYLPPFCGQAALSMKVVAGLTIVQSLFASSFGALAHRSYDSVDARLALWLGVPMLGAAFAGAWWSGSLDARSLLVLFAALASASALLMLVPGRRNPAAETAATQTRVAFNRSAAASLGLMIGLSGGMVGQSGAFMVVPAMIRLLKIPLRTALGSTLVVVLLASIAGTTGKLLAGQIVLPLAAALALPAAAGARLGARWSHSVKPDLLQRLLALLIAAAALRIWYDLAAAG